MAAFSYQQHNSYLLDPTLLFPNPTTTTNIGTTNGTTTNTAAAWFHQPQDHSFHGHHYNLVSVANKLQSSDSSMSMFLDNQKAVETGNALLANNICKDKQIMSSLNQTQSKDTKQNKMNDYKEKKKKKNTKKGYSEEGAVDYVHVRARRGQATDSHSLAERVRREKISQRMKLLQSIVPGCDKVTGKALLLDEIINYIQSLQNQVEFLSMKLATLNPMLYDFGVDMDTVMLKPDENMSSMVLPSTQRCSPNGGATTIAPATNDNFNQMPPLIYGSAATNSLLFQQPQMPSIFLSQGNGHQMWNVDEQKLKLDNRFAFSNNLSSFH